MSFGTSNILLPWKYVINIRAKNYKIYTLLDVNAHTNK